MGEHDDLRVLDGRQLRPRLRLAHLVNALVIARFERVLAAATGAVKGARVPGVSAANASDSAVEAAATTTSPAEGIQPAATKAATTATVANRRQANPLRLPTINPTWQQQSAHCRPLRRIPLAQWSFKHFPSIWRRCLGP